MNTFEQINLFASLHKIFTDMLLDDTWLCTKPIDEEEIKACWHWAVKLGIESIPKENFEDEFGFTFQDFTEYWNNKILQIG